MTHGRTDGSNGCMGSWMDVWVDGWTHGWWMDRLVVMTWELCGWWRITQRRNLSQQFAGVTWPRPTGGKKSICTGFVAVSEHLRILFDIHHLQQCSNTSLFHPYLNNSAAVDLPNANLQSIVEGGLRFWRWRRRWQCRTLCWSPRWRKPQPPASGVLGFGARDSNFRPLAPIQGHVGSDGEPRIALNWTLVLMMLMTNKKSYLDEMDEAGMRISSLWIRSYTAALAA